MGAANQYLIEYKTLYEMEPIFDTAWGAKTLRLDRPGTQEKN